VGALMVAGRRGSRFGFQYGHPIGRAIIWKGHLLRHAWQNPPAFFLSLRCLVFRWRIPSWCRSAVSASTILWVESVERAAGEAFDNRQNAGAGITRVGPESRALAEKGQAGRLSLSAAYDRRPGLDFSFSGLKTFT